MSEALTTGQQEVIDVPAYETVQADTKLAAIRVLSSTGEPEATETLRDRKGEVLAMMQRLAASAGLSLVLRNSEQAQDGVSVEGMVADETGEEAEGDPRLAPFKVQFDTLSETARRNLSWAQVVKGMSQSVDALLANVGKLENAKVFEVDENDNLVFSDGGYEVPRFTLNKNYFDNRRETKAAGLELFTEAEYRRFQSGERKYEKQMITWLESGENPSRALYAYWRYGRVNVDDSVPKLPDEARGARRLLRVKLNLGV